MSGRSRSKRMSSVFTNECWHDYEQVGLGHSMSIHFYTLLQYNGFGHTYWLYCGIKHDKCVWLTYNEITNPSMTSGYTVNRSLLTCSQLKGESFYWLCYFCEEWGVPASNWSGVPERPDNSLVYVIGKDVSSPNVRSSVMPSKRKFRNVLPFWIFLIFKYG